MKQQNLGANVAVAAVGTRIIMGVFGFVFFGVGVTVLVFLWGVEDGFGAPPLIFRVFGSFIALAFVTMGGVTCVSAIVGGKLMGMQAGVASVSGMEPRIRDAQVAAAGRYVCTHCGAPLADKADVSPLGDVKCTFCGSWFNVHGKRA